MLDDPWLAGAAYCEGLGQERRDRGVYYTPRRYCEELVGRALGPQLERVRSVEELLSLRVCDPAVGFGGFLWVAGELLEKRARELGVDVEVGGCLVGVDVDEGAVAQCRELLGRRFGPVKVTVGDSLLLPPGSLKAMSAGVPDWAFDGRAGVRWRARNARERLGLVLEGGDVELGLRVWAAAVLQDFAWGEYVLTTRDVVAALRGSLSAEALARALVVWNRYRPVPWDLWLPEGCNVVVTNPPFVGAWRLPSLFGERYVQVLRRLWWPYLGQADYSALFVRLAWKLTGGVGRLGFVLPKASVETDTREAGLGLVEREGARIVFVRRVGLWDEAAVDTLLVGVVGKRWWDVPELDGLKTPYISPSLDSCGERAPQPVTHGLPGRVFGGLRPRGRGLLFTEREKDRLLQLYPDLRRFFFPYMTGNDLLLRTPPGPGKWALIATGETLPSLDPYPELEKLLLRRGLRESRARVGEAKKRWYWWEWWDVRQDVLGLIGSGQRVLIRPRLSALHVYWWQEPVAFSDQVVVFADVTDYHFGLLQSTVHRHWALRYCSTRLALRYNVTDGVHTFPVPVAPAEWRERLLAAMRHYDDVRREILEEKRWNLRMLYRAYDEGRAPERFVRVQELCDELVLRSYGWGDLEVEYEIQETDGRPVRVFKRELATTVLDRLVDLNLRSVAA